MGSDLMGSTAVLNSIPTPTERDYALAKAYLEKLDGLEDIIEMLGL